MEHTGYIKINRKNVPYHLIDDKVTLIPYDTYSALLPSEIKEKEILKGITTGNREVAFLNCRYSRNKLAYQVLIISTCNTGLYDDISLFDRICFEGKPVNVFAGPGRACNSEESYDISKRMKSIIPRNWEELNVETNLKIKNREMKLSIDYSIWHNKKFIETSMGEAIPRFCIEYSKTLSIKNIPAVYLQVYDFFSFISFRRNIVFDKIYIQRKIEGKHTTVAEVIVTSKDFGDYNNTERNSIIIDDCRENFGDLFKCVAQRRSQKIYDQFYIPKNGKENSQLTYEKFLSCALSLESEYARLYPSKKDENEKFEFIQGIFQESADKMNMLFTLAAEDRISRDEFEKCFYGDLNSRLKKYFESMSKTKARSYQSYYLKIVETLSKIDYSLGEKYKNALNMHMDLVKPIIGRLSSANGVAFPSENEAGKIFADFRNRIAHGNPPEIENIHCVLYEVARALIYIMILKNAGMDEKSIKNIVKKLF